MAKLIVIYAGYGDTLLLQKPAVVDPVSGQPQHKYWLIDGGPITSAPSEDQGTRNAYQQYLKLALKRFCASRTDPNHLYQIDLLEGIIVSHPHTDHINGVVKLIDDWLPDRVDTPISEAKPLVFHGPVVLNASCFGQHRELCDLLGRKHFDVKDWQIHDFRLQNESIQSVYEMNRSGDPLHVVNLPNIDNIIVPNAGIQKAPQNHQFDPSHTNHASILTTWANNNVLELVTTGDGLAAYILDGMGNIQPNGDKILDVFKVPHHGSEKNSQLGDPITSDELEERHHVFLVMSLCDISREPGLINQATWDVLRAVKATTLDVLPKIPEFQHDWDRHLRNLGTEFHDTQLTKLYAKSMQTNHKIEIDTASGLAGAVLPLAQRYLGIIEGNEVEDMIHRIRYKDGGHQWTVDNILHFTEDKEFYNNLKKSAVFIGKLRIAHRIKNFYLNFRAKNYVISANDNAHEHPSPTLVAGLIAAIIAHHRADTTYKASIIVTDGQSVKRDDIAMLVRTMVRGVLPAQWADAVSIHYLENDYLVPVPLDTKGVNSLGVIPLDDGQPLSDYLRKLHYEFDNALEPSLPRAIDPEQSKFRIITRDPNGVQQWYLSVSNDVQRQLTLENQPALVSFRFRAPNVRWTVTNPWLQVLVEGIVQGVRTRRTTAFSVRFGEATWTSPAAPCHVYQDDANGPLQLQYDPNPNAFQPPPISFQRMPVVDPVQVTFERE